MGIALVGWAALGCYFIVNPSLSWRLLLATQAIPALLLFGCSFKLLESPRWHLLKGHAEKARTILCKLHGGPNDPHNLRALQEQITISEQIELDSQRPNSWIDLFRQPPLRKRMLVGLMMMMVNQNTGQNVLYAYRKFGIYSRHALPVLIYRNQPSRWSWCPRLDAFDDSMLLPHLCCLFERPWRHLVGRLRTTEMSPYWYGT
jgi:hypothetical protein